MNKILKGFNVLLLSALSGAVAHGKGVDENTAKVIGANQLISVSAKGVSGPADLTTAYVATAQTAYGVLVDYYVFNIQGGIGFVMVSGDDNIIPVLAYSTESSFDIDHMAPATKDWIDGYKNEITASITHNVPAEEGTAAQWAGLMNPVKGAAAKKTTVAPLTATKWDQEPSYNNLCPVPGSGSSSTPTGCVATSIAQVMKYWNWPTIGAGYHTYKPASYSARSADFGDTAYNWSAMVPLASNNYIAHLMSQVGVAVDMNYGPGESGAYTLSALAAYAGKINCSEYALKNYFHYKRTMSGKERYSDYTGVSTVVTATWSGYLTTELDAGRPVLYNGSGSSGGHAWVCDGYDATGKFHMNWGWGSLSDGYFTVNSLAPAALGTGGGGSGNNFNTFQAIIVGIQPDSFNAVSDNMKLAAHVDHQVNMPATYPVGAFTVNTNVVNTGSTAFSGDFRLEFFDVNLKDKFTMQTITGKSVPAGGSLPLAFTTSTTMYQLVPSYYKLRVQYRATGSSTWSLVGDNGIFLNENGLDVMNSQIIELAKDITLSGTTSIKIGSSLTVTGQILNASNTDVFNGNVRAVFTNVTTGTQTAIGAAATDNIFSNGYGTVHAFTTASVSVPAGTYTIAIQHKDAAASAYTYSGADLYQNPIIVTVGYGGVGINTPTLVAENISVYPNPANDVINVDWHGAAVSRITITDIQGRQVQELNSDGTQSAVAIQVNNYAAGIYFVNLFSGEEVVTKKIVVAK